MPNSIDSSRRTAGSVLSIRTNSSRASDAYHTDAERGQRNASRMSRSGTMSEGGEKSDYESGSTPKIYKDQVKRKREFKGRHIQMMGIGISPF
jgi:amino acid permease